MKNLKKLLQITLSMLIISFMNINTVQSVTLNNFIVNFEDGTDIKYIKLINIFTNTKIEKKISGNRYLFSVDKELKNYSTHNYSDLLGLIPEVKSVESNIISSLKNKKAGDYIDGFILVRYKDGTSLKEIDKIDSKYNTKSVLFSKSLSLYKVKLPITLTIDKAVSIFSKLDHVKYAEADRIMKIQNKNNFSITFAENNSEVYQKIFENILEINLIKANNSFIANFPDDYDSNKLINSLKISPLIMDIKQVK